MTQIKQLRWSDKAYCEESEWKIKASVGMLGYELHFYDTRKDVDVYLCEVCFGKLWARTIYKGPDLDEAKAAAQAHFETMVKECLE